MQRSLSHYAAGTVLSDYSVCVGVLGIRLNAGASHLVIVLFASNIQHFRLIDINQTNVVSQFGYFPYTVYHMYLLV